MKEECKCCSCAKCTAGTLTEVLKIQLEKGVSIEALDMFYNIALEIIQEKNETKLNMPVRVRQQVL